MRFRPNVSQHFDTTVHKCPTSAALAPRVTQVCNRRAAVPVRLHTLCNRVGLSARRKQEKLSPRRAERASGSGLP